MIEITKKFIYPIIFFSTSIPIIYYIKKHYFESSIKLKEHDLNISYSTYNQGIKKNKIDSKIKEIENEKNSKVLILTNIIEFTKFHLQIFDNNNSELLKEKFDNIYHNKNIDLILHTIGGNSYCQDVITELLSKHKLNHKINVYVPYYSLSSGTVFALYGDVINVMPYSLLSPIDNQYTFSNKKSYSVRLLTNKNIIEKHDELLDITLVDKIKKLKIYDTKKILENLMFKYGHHMSFTYQDLIFFGIKNLNLSVDNKIFELMDLLYENYHNRNIILEEAIENIEKKRNSKIFIMKNYLDLVIFLNNNEIKKCKQNQK